MYRKTVLFHPLHKGLGGKELRSLHPGACPGAFSQELHHNNGVKGGLCNYRLAADIPHTLLVVRYLIDIDLPLHAVFFPFYPETCRGFTVHGLGDTRRIRCSCTHYIPGRDFHIPNLYFIRLVQSQRLKGFEHFDKGVLEAELKGNPLQPPLLKVARQHEHLFVLHINHFYRSYPLGQVEYLRLGERFGGIPSPFPLPNNRGIEALLYARPDGEPEGYIGTFHFQVGSVAYIKLFHGVKKMVRGVPGKYVYHTGFHTGTHQGEKSRLFPLLRLGELKVAQLYMGPGKRLCRVTLGEAHGHIDVGTRCFVGCVEKGHIELRTAGVHYKIHSVFSYKSLYILLISRIEPCRCNRYLILQNRGYSLCFCLVVIG